MEIKDLFQADENRNNIVNYLFYFNRIEMFNLLKTKNEEIINSNIDIYNNTNYLFDKNASITRKNSGIFRCIYPYRSPLEVF